MAVTLFGGLLDIVRISMKHKQFGTDVSLQLMLTACVFISTQTGTSFPRSRHDASTRRGCRSTAKPSHLHTALGWLSQ